MEEEEKKKSSEYVSEFVKDLTVSGNEDGKHMRFKTNIEI